MNWLLGAQAATTLFMTGVIWFVQVVHYPLMARVGAEVFPTYQALHARRTGRVVIAPMSIELATTLGLLVRPPAFVPGWQIFLGAALLGMVWLSTFLLQVPEHRRLADGFDGPAHRRLVSSNWIRVVGWSARSVLVVGWLFLACRGS